MMKPTSDDDSTMANPSDPEMFAEKLPYDEHLMTKTTSDSEALEMQLSDDKQGNKKRTKTIILICGVVVLCSVIAIIVGVVVGTKKTKNTTQAPATVQAQPRFVESRSFVSDVCAIFNDTNCQDTCQDIGGCCSYASNATCLVDDLDGCRKYAACHVLDSGIERPPDSLDSICSLETLANSSAPCKKACQKVECCWNDLVEGCQPLQFLSCLDYSACQNLKPNTDLKVAPSDLDEICSDDLEGCATICKQAECCWNETLNCLATDFFTCISYAPCGKLLLPEPNTVTISAPQDLNVTCNADNLIAGTNVKECEDACQSASCCTSETDNCFLDDPLGCLGYAPCGLLYLTGGSVPKAPANLEATCSWDNLIAGFDEPCIELCQPASCCVSLNVTDNCLANGNALACLEYGPCALLVLVGGEGMKDAPDELEEICSDNNTMTEVGLAECEDICNLASCCWDFDSDNCFVGNVDICSDWTFRGCYKVFGFGRF